MTRETGAFAVRQEEDSIPGGRLAKIAVVAIGVGLAGVFFAALLLETKTGAIRGHLPGGASPGAATPAIAGVAQTPLFGAAEGLALRQRQREELTRYRWVDRDAGLAAIPIERAMDLVAREPR
jgi:hypothetical protein